MSISTIDNGTIRVSVDEHGQLTELINKKTGHNYASGGALWRFYFEIGTLKDREVLGVHCKPLVRCDDTTITLQYDSVVFEESTRNIALTIGIAVEQSDVRWSIKIDNNDPEAIIRDVHFPTIGNIQLTDNQELIWSRWGGERVPDIKDRARKNHTLWMSKSDHIFTSTGVTYLGFDWPNLSAAMNFFLFAGKEEGIYFGLHTTEFENTDHHFRLYGEKLEPCFVRYPSIAPGSSWHLDDYQVTPYSGTWHVAAEKYRCWANSWFRQASRPNWVEEMNGWQRIIMKHQYGEIHYSYDQLPEIYRDGQKAGIHNCIMFGWWPEGMDNGYPIYRCDEEMGGEEAMAHGIQDFQNAGGQLTLYVSGRMIDVTTDYYKDVGKRICIKDQFGTERRDGYHFTGNGCYVKNFGMRTFVVACTTCEEWVDHMKRIIDMAVQYGCKSVFFDQVGIGEMPCCDPSHGHPVPYMGGGWSKADMLRRLHEHIDEKQADCALSTELLTDLTAQHVAYIHARWGACAASNNWEQTGEKPDVKGFVDLFRYTFPEVIFSDREIRDDTDIERRVNHAALKGLRNDVEIYRCRKTIAETPHYQDYLGKVCALRTKYADYLLKGTYCDTRNFVTQNSEIDARAFRKGDHLAILLTQSHRAREKDVVCAPGYCYKKHDGVGDFLVESDGDVIAVTVGQHGLVLVLLQKTT